MSHTTGPWGIETVDHKRRIITAKDGKYDIAVVRDIGNEDNGANARLIAAAPLLLKELRLMNVDENGEQKRNTPAWRVIAMAEGLI